MWFLNALKNGPEQKIAGALKGKRKRSPPDGPDQNLRAQSTGSMQHGY
jgi:hypothetical protein